MNSSTPVVSIGMPVYNSAALISRALDSMLNQSFADFELIISDNASTDRTAEICKAYAAKDSRIRYVRQPTNIGAIKNFEFVLNEAVGEFFMWVADDDLRSEGFLEANLEVMRHDETCVFAASPHCLEGDEGDPDKWRKFSLEGDTYERISAFFDDAWVSQGCFYALIRRKYLIGHPELFGDHLAFDWAVNIHLLTHGSFKRAKKEWIKIGCNGMSRQEGYVASTRTRPIHYVVPLYEFSTLFVKSVWHATGLGFAQKMALYVRLFRLNATLFVGPWYRRAAGRIKSIFQRGAA